MKQFLVIGLGRFGTAVATELSRLGHEVLAVDRHMENVEAVADIVTHAVCTDASQEDELAALGVSNFDAAIVAIGGDLQASILITMLLKEAGVPYILSKAKSHLHAKILEKMGADKVVQPEDEMGTRVARTLVSASVMDFIELSPDYSLVELGVPASWRGKALRELAVPAKYGINIIAIKDGNGGISVTPKAGDVLAEGQVLVVIGGNRDIEKVENLK